MSGDIVLYIEYTVTALAVLSIVFSAYWMIRK